VIDATSRHDLSVPIDRTVADALHAARIDLDPARQTLLGRGGRQIAPGSPIGDLDDGAVLTVVETGERRPTARSGMRRRRDAVESAALWWTLGALGLGVAVVALGAPDAIVPSARPVLAAVALAAAIASSVPWATRASPRATGAGSAWGPLALAFAGGAVAIPEMPAASASLAVFTGLGCAAALAGLLGLVASAATFRAELGVTAVVLLPFALVWGAAMMLDLPVSAPAAVSLGLVPVARRLLVATLLDVSPGMFIDYPRFQTTRWSVRQTYPEPGGPISASTAAEVAVRSSARLVAGTATLSLIAAATAPIALPGFPLTDPLVFAGRVALAICAAAALLLGSRRALSPVTMWMPRLAATVVIGTAVAGIIGAFDADVLAVSAVVLLAAGVLAGLAAIPIARGARSLAWSRTGDVIEWLAIALALPAGLMAADAIDLLRGMMGA